MKKVTLFKRAEPLEQFRKTTAATTAPLNTEPTTPDPEDPMSKYTPKNLEAAIEAARLVEKTNSLPAQGPDFWAQQLEALVLHRRDPRDQLQVAYGKALQEDEDVKCMARAHAAASRVLQKAASVIKADRRLEPLAKSVTTANDAYALALRVVQGQV